MATIQCCFSKTWKNINLMNFSKDKQRKSICFLYEMNAKGKKYAKSLTWREFKGKSYIKT